MAKTGIVEYSVAVDMVVSEATKKDGFSDIIVTHSNKLHSTLKNLDNSSLKTLKNFALRV